MVTSLGATSSDQLIRVARANVERSEGLIARAETAKGRHAAIRRNPARISPSRHSLSRVPVATGTKGWLLAIASVIKDWPTMPKDDIGATMAEATPAEATAYIVELQVPRDLRASILRALPPLTPYSFHHAAWQI